MKALKRDEENNLLLVFSKEILLSSIHPSFYRVLLLPHLKDSDYIRNGEISKNRTMALQVPPSHPAYTKQSPKRFKQLYKDLRKHHFEDYVKQLIVRDVVQLELDRIFYISFSKRSTGILYYLFFELTGPSSNVFLLDKEMKIVSQYKKTKKNRTGEIYSFNSISIDKIETHSSEKVLQDISNAKSPILALQKKFKKLPLWLKETLNSASEQEANKYFSKITKNVKPYILFKNKLPLFISPIKITGDAKTKTSFSSAVFELYRSEIEKEKKEKIRREIVKYIKAKERVFEKLKTDLNTAKSSQKFKKMGELILVNLQSIKKGEKTINIKDPYEKGRLIKIDMDPSKSPIKNAEEYFKKHRKAKRSRNIVETRIKDVSEEIEKMNELREGIDNLSQIELTELEKKFLPQKIAKRKLKKEEKRFRTFLTSGKKTILVGRNRHENERLTFDFSKPRDLFFHVREAPGSHTILVNDGKLSKNDIIEAAKSAAFFSRAKHSTIVPVSYTERRYVRRSKRLGPGKVILTKEKTIFVKPGIPNHKK